MNNFESTCRSESNASGVYSTKPARTKMMKLFLPLQASALVLSFWTLGSQAFVELPSEWIYILVNKLVNVLMITKNSLLNEAFVFSRLGLSV